MLYKTLVLAVVLAAASCVRLGANKCTWGPGYWCKGLETAKECGTENHCRTKVWVGNHPLAKITSPVPNDNNIPPAAAAGSPPKEVEGGNCAICELVGKEIFNKMKENATEAEFIAELDTLCEYVPGTDTCKSFVDEYGKMFYEEFIENASVKDLCTYLGFCSAEFISILKSGKVMSHLISKDVGGIGCDSCQSIMALMQKEVLTNQKALEGMLDQVCSVIPVDQAECDSTINGLFEATVSILESYKPLELCQMVGVCSDMKDQLLGVGPVKFGQVGQTGPASMNLGTDDSCQNGPAFWCSSEENARLCKAEDFCKKNDAPLVF